MNARAAASLALLAGTLAGCGDEITTGGPPGPDLTTVPTAMAALEDAYSRRKAADAISFLEPGYRFVPALPESIHFFAPGDTSWSYDQEVVILSELLVEEQTSWIDQVLLDFTGSSQDTMTDGSVEVTTRADLTLVVTNDVLQQSRSTIVLVYRRNQDGLWLLAAERESAWPGSKSVGQLKADVLIGP
ncbi:MAG: hypothetical protein ACRDGR_05030 [bacterium]